MLGYRLIRPALILTFLRRARKYPSIWTHDGKGARIGGAHFSPRGTKSNTVLEYWAANFLGSWARKITVAIYPTGKKTTDPISNRNIATADAAYLLFASLERTLSDVRAPAKSLAVAIIPLFCIRWNREVCERVRGIHRLMCRLRNSNLQHDAYLRLKNPPDESILFEGAVPNHWEEWAAVFGNYELVSALGIFMMGDLVFGIQRKGFDSPCS